MGKTKKILVAVDGSESSKNALRQSFKLHNDDTEFTVVSVSPYFNIDHPLTEVNSVNEILKKQSDHFLDEANDIAVTNQIQISTKQKDGEIYTKIIETAEEEGCELIVMGRRGMTRIERALLGDETDRVVGHFNGSTLVVPNNTTLGLKNVLIATDGSKHSDNALDEAIKIAKAYKSLLKIVYAVSITDELAAHASDAVNKATEKALVYLNELKNEAARSGVEADIYVREGRPYRVIIDLANELNSDIIIMGSHGRTGLKRIFMGSVTARVIGHAPCPVMVVNKH